MSAGRWVLRLYPRDWRRRYGEEMEDLIAAVVQEHGRLPLRARVDLLLAALHERVHEVIKVLRIDRGVALRAGPVAAVLALAVAVGLFGFGSTTPKGARSSTIPTSALSSDGPTVGHAQAAARAAAAAQAQMQAQQARAASLQAEAAARAVAAAQAQMQAQQAQATLRGPGR